MSTLPLFPLVASAIALVSAPERVRLLRSAGFENRKGELEPRYEPALEIEAWIQPLNGDVILPENDWTRIGDIRKAWLCLPPPPVSSVERNDGRGGDLIGRADGSWWRVDAVLETFAAPGEEGWFSVRISRQLEGPVLPPGPEEP